MSVDNDPESRNLSREEIETFEAARTAANSLSKTFELWMTLARGVEAARERADRLGTRSAFQRILDQQGLAAALGNTWNSQKSTANKLLAILNRRADVEAWREGLTKHQRIHWSAPTTVYKHCPLFQSAADVEAKEDKNELAKIDKKSQGKAEDWAQGPEMPNDERDQFQSEIEALKSRIAELEAEVMALRGQLAERETRHDGGPAAAVEADMAKRGEAMESRAGKLLRAKREARAKAKAAAE